LSEETRQHPRYAIDVAVTLTTGDEQVTGRCRNVSRGGLCAHVPIALPMGTAVTASLELTFDTNTVSEPLALPARIMWSTALGAEHQLGAAFMPLTENQTKFLDLFLKYIEEGDARRRAESEPPEPEDPFSS
jgi:hypothetical protein